MFSDFGTIGEIFLHRKPTTAIPNPDNLYFPQEKDLIPGYKVAYLVFEDPRSVKELMHINMDELEELVLGETKCGMKSKLK